MNDLTGIDAWRQFLYYSDPDFRTAADAYGVESRQATKAMLVALTDRCERIQKEMGD